MTRKTYYLCRYVRTNKVRKEGHGYLLNKKTGCLASLPRATSYVYQLKRVAGPLLLTEQEAGWIMLENDVEGCAHLLTEALAIEGKEL